MDFFNRIRFSFSFCSAAAGIEYSTYDYAVVYYSHSLLAHARIPMLLE